ncbi:MAG: hypothetical protein HOV68_05460 [Streptomycetaceae bacterium]|nr:hypothetical protein [Streptomycetaceae bacterium]
MLHIWDPRPEAIAQCDLDDATLLRSIRTLVPDARREDLARQYGVALAAAHEPGHRGSLERRLRLAYVLAYAGLDAGDLATHGHRSDPVLLRHMHYAEGFMGVRVSCTACPWTRAFSLHLHTQTGALREGKAAWEQHTECPGTP